MRLCGAFITAANSLRIQECFTSEVRVSLPAAKTLHCQSLRRNTSALLPTLTIQKLGMLLFVQEQFHRENPVIRPGLTVAPLGDR